MRELAGPAVLLDVPVEHAGHAPVDGLAVGDPRAAHGDRQTGALPELLHGDLQVQLAQPGEQGLPGLRVDADGQRRVLLDERGQCLRQALRVGAGARLDGDRHQRIGDPRRLQQHGVRTAGERGADLGGLHPGDGDDVTGRGTVDLGVAVGLDPQDAGDAFGAPGARVPHGVPLRDRAVVNAQVGEPTGPRGVHLEDQGDQILAAGPRRRQVVDDGVEQRLDALVAVGGAAEHGHRLAFPGQVADGRAQGPVRDVAQFLQCGGVQRGDLLLQGAACGERLGRAVRQADQVDDTTEVALLADRQLHHERDDVQPVPDGRDRRRERRARPVELVDEGDPRDAVAIRRPPDRLGLRLDPGHRVEHGDRAVQHAQRTFHLVGEVHVPGRVDQIEPMTGPVTADGGREDGDPTVALLWIEVGDGRTVVNLALFVGGAGDVEDPLGESGLAGVDVGENAEIADTHDGSFFRFRSVVDVRPPGRRRENCLAVRDVQPRWRGRGRAHQTRGSGRIATRGSS